jgi:hypothetical protein
MRLRAVTLAVLAFLPDLEAEVLRMTGTFSEAGVKVRSKGQHYVGMITK